MDELLTEEELAAAAKMGVSAKDYQANKPPAELTPEALAIGAKEVAMALGISEADWEAHGAILITEETDNGV